jgi:hypothetical protein
METFEEDLIDIEIDPVDQENLDQLMLVCSNALDVDSDGNMSVNTSLLFDILEELQEYRRKDRIYETHMVHCNIWPYDNSCKYGEDETCPALLRKIDVDQLAQALYSVQGGVNTSDGTWSSDIVRGSFIDQAEKVLEILNADSN